MILHSVIRNSIIYCIFFLSFSAFSQNTQKDSIFKNRQRFGMYSIGFHRPIPTGNSFVGNGMSGKSGFDFKIQLYVYKQFFIGGSVGASYLKVDDTSITGNYEKTTIAEQYLFLGYEFLPFENWRLGINASLIGDAIYKNKIYPKPEKGVQTDTARYNGYGFYISYEFSNNFMIFIDYTYRNDKTQIEVPNEIQDVFKKANFHIIGFGIKITFGDNDIISLKL